MQNYAKELEICQKLKPLENKIFNTKTALFDALADAGVQLPKGYKTGSHNKDLAEKAARRYIEFTALKDIDPDCGKKSAQIITKVYDIPLPPDDGRGKAGTYITCLKSLILATADFKGQPYELFDRWGVFEEYKQFNADHPNQIWVSDITYFRIKDSWMYLCAIIDLFSRRVVGYRISRTASTRLVTTTFRDAYAERGNPKNLTFHSDRGGQYISDALSKLLQQFGVKQSFSATARPHDNAVAEAFFATFKKEEAYRREYTSEKHFRKSVNEYIRFYNEVRPHQTLKYKTPRGFEAAYDGGYIEKSCSNSGSE